jgi:hypothetical protein
MHKVGAHFVADMRDHFRYEGEAVAGVEREEFVEACGRLERAGYQLHNLDKAWEAFSLQRSKYGAWLNQTTKGLSVLPAPWIGDRSYLPHRERPAPGRGQQRVA